MVWGAIASVVGMGVSALGASKQQSSQNKAIKNAHKGAVNDWKYQNEEAERRIDFQREQNDVTRDNNLRNAKYQDASQLQNWQYGLQMQDFEYGTALLAKWKSDQSLNEQLQFNKGATLEATLAQDAWMDDRKTERAFNLLDLDLQLDQSKDALTKSFNDILVNKGREQAQTFGQMRQNQLQKSTDLAKTSFTSQNNQIDMLLAQGKAENGQAGRSQGKAIQSATSSGGRKEAELTEQADTIFKIAAMQMDDLNTQLYWTNTGATLQKESVGRDYMNKWEANYNSRWSVEESFTSAQRQDQRNRAGIQRSKRQADMTAYANNKVMPLKGPIAPPPFATPIPTILDPKDHVWSPKPIKGAPVSGGVLSSIGSNLPGVVSSVSAAFNKPTKPT